jgi:hypothetical protein
MKQIFAFVFFLATTALAHAQTPGEISKVDSNGTVQFATGDNNLKVGEELRMVGSSGARTYLQVTEVQGKEASGLITKQQSGPGGMFERVLPGDKVVLQVPSDKLKVASFFVGPNFSQKTAGYGGSNYFLGILFAGPINEKLFWNFRLQADSFGKQTGVEKRRGAYLAGIGSTWKGARFEADLGVIDTMSIVAAEANSAPQTVDPATGAVYPSKGVYHNNKIGYLVGVNYPFRFAQPDRNRPWGWSLSPVLTYSDTFANQGVKGAFSLGASIDIWIE